MKRKLFFQGRILKDSWEKGIFTLWGSRDTLHRDRTLLIPTRMGFGW